MLMYKLLEALVLQESFEFVMCIFYKRGSNVKDAYGIVRYVIEKNNSSCVENKQK